MISIESSTLIVKGKHYEQVVLDVMNFFELEGKNVLYITDSKVENLLSYLNCNIVNFTGRNYKKVIKSNLYNVEIILVTSTAWLLLPVKEFIDKLKIPAIYIQSNRDTNTDHTPSKIEFNNIYEMYVKTSRSRTPSEFLLDKDRNMVKDIKNGWQLSTSELKIKYIRDKKISDLLNGI